MLSTLVVREVMTVRSCGPYIIFPSGAPLGSSVTLWTCPLYSRYSPKVVTWRTAGSGGVTGIGVNTAAGTGAGAGAGAGFATATTFLGDAGFLTPQRHGCFTQPQSSLEQFPEQLVGMPAMFGRQLLPFGEGAFADEEQQVDLPG